MTKWYDVPTLLAELTQCIADKWSARQTADKISRLAGYPVSRNALIGKARRDHLGRFQSDDIGQYPRRPAKPRKRRPSIAKYHSAPTPIPLPAEPVMQADFLCISFDALKPGQCKFPHGDDPLTMTYCGQPAVNEGPWCSFHKQICTVQGSNQWRPGSSSTSKTTV